MMLLSASVCGIRKFIAIKICEAYAESYGLAYNVLKSQVVIFRERRKILEMPNVFLNGCVLQRVNKFKHLGHLLTIYIFICIAA
jgi:hypothetical protein